MAIQGLGVAGYSILQNSSGTGVPGSAPETGFAARSTAEPDGMLQAQAGVGMLRNSLVQQGNQALQLINGSAGMQGVGSSDFPGLPGVGQNINLLV